MRYLLLFLFMLFTLPVFASERAPVSIPALYALDRPGKVSLPLGKEPFVLHVFASWCNICTAEAPLMQHYQRKLDVPLYGMTWQDIPADSIRWLQRNGSAYETVLIDNDGTAGDILNITGAPETLLFDRSGRIVWRYAGGLEPQVFLEQLLPAVRKANPSPPQ